MVAGNRVMEALQLPRSRVRRDKINLMRALWIGVLPLPRPINGWLPLQTSFSRGHIVRFIELARSATDREPRPSPASTPRMEGGPVVKSSARNLDLPELRNWIRAADPATARRIAREIAEFMIRQRLLDHRLIGDAIRLRGGSPSPRPLVRARIEELAVRPSPFAGL